MSKLLITGGTGSFGHAILNYPISLKVDEIIVFSRDENKQYEMRNAFKNHKLKFIVGDIRDYDSINSAMSEIKYVFHAAALKQVPSCEFFPLEAVKTNILGAQNVMMASIENNVKSCILLSTDKAVLPYNAMGMTKGIMEKVMQSISRSNKNKNTIFSSTRYGNVLCSRGSVIPYFVNLLKTKQRLRITNPKMTRFLMSLSESVKLVEHAFKNAHNGDIFVQKSPSCTLEVLGKALCEIFNRKYDPIIVGTRHGEKEHETLLSAEEKFRSIEQKKFFRVPSDTRELSYDKYFIEGKTNLFTEFNDYSSNNTLLLNVKEVVNLLISNKEFLKLYGK